MNLRLSIAAVLVGLSTTAAAAPTVVNNTISWPDNGWYQVQKVTPTSITNICEGGQSCEVSDGDYTVINHSTGERFDGIMVPGGGPAQSGVTVQGNMVSWPNDGWYQVLNGSTYQQVCAGVASCELQPGSYIVINHTTGKRFENVVVGEEPGNGSSIEINGNTLSWANDGWYQVQSASTFATVCEGGTSCDVLAGTYIVINHSTGMRWEDIVVGSGGPTMPDPDTEYNLPADSGTTPAPMGISIAVYGDSAAELNWIRPFYGDGITINEIWRDGVKIEEIAGGGNSYVDTQRVAGQSYTYHVVALSQFGRATTKFVETNGTVANPIDPVIATQTIPAELEQQVANTMHLLSGVPMQRVASTALKLLSSSSTDLGLTFVSSEDRFETSNCPNGGTIIRDTFSGNRRFQATDCTIGTISITGTFFDQSDRSGSNNQYSPLNQSGSLAVTDSRDGTTIFAGYTSIRYDQENNISSFESRDLSVVGSVYNYTADNIFVSFEEGELEVGGEGLSNVLGQNMRPRTMGAVSVSSTSEPTTGAIAFNSMERGDQTYGINIGNGNPETFTLNQTIDGVLTSYDIAWSDRMSLTVLNLNDFNVGF